jgi:hypothetical protein
MTTKGALKQLKSVWGKSGLEGAPGPEETVGRLEEPRRGRKRSDRTAQLNLRIRPEEKEQITLFAVRDRVSINEVFSRVLELYAREHGSVELTSKRSDG